MTHTMAYLSVAWCILRHFYQSYEAQDRMLFGHTCNVADHYPMCTSLHVELDKLIATLAENLLWLIQQHGMAG